MTNGLQKLDNATRMLSEAKSLDEIKHVMDIAEAARTYAKAAKLGLEAYNYAAEIKVRAERKAGEFLAKLERGSHDRGNQHEAISQAVKQPPSQYKAALNDNDIGYMKAHRWQEVSRVPEVIFEAEIGDSYGERPITTSGIVKKAKAIENKNKPKPEIPDGKYRVLYADPPWKYTSGDQHTKTEQDTTLVAHYNSMSIKELCALPIESMAQDDAVLFLWTTSPLLEECFDIIKAWGFKYKTSIVWDKDAHNVGYYISVRHEFLLICTRGSCRPDIRKLLPSVVKEKRGKHSVKPETFRQMIDTMYPNGKRIELFARRPADGWEVWGDDAA